MPKLADDSTTAWNVQRHPQGDSKGELQRWGSNFSPVDKIHHLKRSEFSRIGIMRSLVVGVFLLLASTRLAAEDAVELFVAASQGRITQVESILARGVDVDARTSNGRTPLMGAAFFGNERIVRLLIGYGADVNAKDKHGVTPLMNAVSGGWIDVVRLLLAAGADVNAEDNAGQTALTRAKQMGRTDLVTLLKATDAQEKKPSQPQQGKAAPSQEQPKQQKQGDTKSKTQQKQKSS